MAMQVSFVAEVENKYPRFITRRIYKPSLEIKPNVYRGKFKLVIRYVSFYHLHKKFPPELFNCVIMTKHFLSFFPCLSGDFTPG